MLLVLLELKSAALAVTVPYRFPMMTRLPSM